MDVVLITGCASGLGRALALELHGRRASQGNKAFKVYATDFRVEAVKELEAEGISTAELDVTSESSIRTTVKSILDVEGRIDMLVCNAGIGAAGWLAEVPMNVVERAYNVNVFGVLRCVQAVAPSMMDRRSGRIVVLSSVNAYVCQAFGALYSGSKAAAAMMTEGLRIELEPFGIRVTSIIPGWCKSQLMINALVALDSLDDPQSQYHKLAPRVRRMWEWMANLGSTPEEVARDLAVGLIKPKPKRFVYTGTWLWYALLGGLLQMWVCSGIIAKKAQRNWGLDQTEKLGRVLTNAPNSKTSDSKKVPQALEKEE